MIHKILHDQIAWHNYGHVCLPAQEKLRLCTYHAIRVSLLGGEKEEGGGRKAVGVKLSESKYCVCSNIKCTLDPPPPPSAKNIMPSVDPSGKKRRHIHSLS